MSFVIFVMKKVRKLAQTVMIASKLVSLILLILILSAARSDAAEPRKLALAYSSVGPMAAGVWMAKEAKIFEKYGLQTDVIFISSGPVVVQALISGDLQGASAASNAAIAAIINGAPIIGVGAAANQPYHRVFVQPEINRVEDLRGKTMGVTRFNSITDNLTRIFLRRSGLEGAVTVRQMGGTLEVAAAFQNKTIAGAVTSDMRVVPPSQPKILVRLVDMGIPYSMNMIMVSTDYLRRNPEAVERLLRAYAEGVAFIHHNKERALKIIAKYAHLPEAKGVEEFYRDATTYLDRVPRTDSEAVQTILEFMGKKGTPLESLYDNSMVDKLAREGFFDKLYSRR
jgi:ABC-type nitrate/sulfonate/bicarbonate transport system substrate-binding protein